MEALFHKDRVIVACEAFLKKRRERIDAQHRKLISDLMLKDQRNFFQWLMLAKPRYLTEEEAIATLKEVTDYFGSQWDDVEYCGSRWAEHVEQILAVAQKATSDVKLTRDDAFLVSYMPEAPVPTTGERIAGIITKWDAEGLPGERQYEAT